MLCTRAVNFGTSRIARAAGLSALALTAAAACTSYEPQWATGTFYDNPVGSLALTLSPSTLSLQPGASQTLQATVTPAGGFSGPVQFEATHLPRGVVISGPELELTDAGTPLTATVTVTASADAAQGSAQVMLGVAANNQATEAALTLNLGSPTITAQPDSLTLTLGADQSNDVRAVEANYAGAFTESDTCAGVATVAQTADASGNPSGIFAVSPIAQSSCTVTLADSQGNSVAVPVAINPS